MTDKATTVPLDAPRLPDLLPAQLSRLWMTRMLALVRRLGRTNGMAETLQCVAEGVVDALGFGAAALNTVQGDGSLRCVAAAGPPAASAALVGGVGSREAWDELLSRAQPCGGLLFLASGPWSPGDTGVPSWTPPHEDSSRDDPSVWQPEDSLLALLRDGDGDLLGVLSVDEPATGRFPDPAQLTLLELYAAEAANALADAIRQARLSDSEVVFRRVFAAAPTPMLVVDRSLDVLHANEAFARLAALRGDRALPNLCSLLPGDDAVALGTACQAVLAGPAETLTVEHRLRRGDGGLPWVRSSVSRVDTEVAGPRLVLRCEDVTDERRTLDELRRLADHDALTGLPNRRIARRRLEHLLAEGSDARRVAVLYCDLDGFKAVNDRLGHAAGDELLSLAAARLGRVIRPPDLLCREGGDEFVVIATIGADHPPDSLARRCVDALAAPFALRAGTAAVTLSVGVAVGRAGQRGTDLLSEADAALYRAKSAGRNGWATLGPDRVAPPTDALSREVTAGS